MSWRFKIDPFQLFNDWKCFRPLEWRKVFSHPKEWMFPCWTLELLLFFSSFVRETFRYFSDKLKLSTEGLIQVEPVQFSRSVVSHSLCPHESQHARPPCSSSPTPRVHSNSHPSSRWCHPAISSSVVPFSSCPQSLPASESFPMSQLFTWGDQSTGVSVLASFLPKNTQGWSPLEWTGWISLQSKALSRVFSNTTVQKHQFFGTQPSSQSNFHIIHDHWKNHSLD